MLTAKQNDTWSMERWLAFSRVTEFRFASREEAIKIPLKEYWIKNIPTSLQFNYRVFFCKRCICMMPWRSFCVNGLSAYLTCWASAFRGNSWMRNYQHSQEDIMNVIFIGQLSQSWCRSTLEGSYILIPALDWALAPFSYRRSIFHFK